MEDKSYIKLSRKILEWEWYTDINTKVLFLHMLLKANWRDGRFQGIEVPRGSFISSIQKLSEETRLSVREVRTALVHLKMTGEVTSESHSKYSMFTVVKYHQYQTDDKQNDLPNDEPMTDRTAGKRQASDKRATTIEEEKEEKERKNNNKNILCKNQDAEELFEHLWKLYPSKKGKGKVSTAAKQRLLKVGQGEMARAIARYQEELEKDADWRKPQNGSTFFTSGYVDYLDTEWAKSHPEQVDPSWVKEPEKAKGTGEPGESGEPAEEATEEEEELVGDDW